MMQTSNKRGGSRAPSPRRIGAEGYGRAAEAACARALEADGFTILARRRRTGAGEIDLIARRDDLTVIVEVKARTRAAEAAEAVSPRQRARLLAAAEALMAEEPGWFGAGLRFDVMVVGRDGTVRRIADAFRAGDSEHPRREFPG